MTTNDTSTNTRHALGQLVGGGLVTILAWGGIYMFAREVPHTGEVIASPATRAATYDAIPEPIDTRRRVAHAPMPHPLKAVYMTSCIAGSPALREDIVDLVDDTEINAIMIDIKDFSGTLSFDPGTSSVWYPAWVESRCGAPDMEEFIADLHERGIFVIGRITVFQDPFYTNLHPEDAVKRSDRERVWKDRKGLSFVDVGARAYWEHIVELTVSAYAIGFDELNFDYVRYPSDGDMADTTFPQAEASVHGTDKAANLEAFFGYLAETLRDPALYIAVIHEGADKDVPWLSADIFGMTTEASDDMRIGQVLERALPYFDAVAPMVYPSHYPKGYGGFANPNDNPYGVILRAMSSGVARTVATSTAQEGFLHTRIGTSTPAQYEKASYPSSRLRTWIQDFDYGGDYGPKEVRAQITASTDAGVESWMIWSPSNVYTRDALHDAE